MASATYDANGTHGEAVLTVPPGAPLAVPLAELGLGASVICCAPAVAARIFERLADGESLRAICRDEGMPSRTAVLRWIEADEAFSAGYARARDHQADALDDEMADVMREVREGRMDPAAARVLLSGLQWRASKLAPKRYGDALNLKHSGGIATVPLEVSHEHAARVAKAILDGMDEGV
jgi:hypothetical protein